MLHQRITTETSQQEADRLLAEDRDARTRRYTVERTLSAQFPWGLRKYGQGVWCVGEGQLSQFTTEAAANAAGEAWVETGRAN